MTTLVEEAVELKPCRACGSECRVELFEGGTIEGVMRVYFCANCTKFGGNCPDPHAYLNINAWNSRPLAALPTDDDVTEAMIEAGRSWFDDKFAFGLSGSELCELYRAMRGAAIHTLIGRAG